MSDNRVDLVFEIFEGGLVEIERISLIAYIQTANCEVFLRQNKPVSLFYGDTFIEDGIEFDKQVLSDFYKSRGYVDFRVNSVNAEFTGTRRYFLTQLEGVNILK